MSGTSTVGDDIEKVTISPSRDKGKEEADSSKKAQVSIDASVAELVSRTSLASLGLGGGAKSKPVSISPSKNTEVKPGYQLHVVSKTDTLTGIAMKYETTVEELKKQNRLWSERDLYSRSTLVVPQVADAERVARERRAKLDLFLETVGREVYGEVEATKWLGRFGWNVERAVEEHLAKEKKSLEESSSGGGGGGGVVVEESLSSSLEEDLRGPSAYYDTVVTQPKDKKLLEKLTRIEDEFNDL